MKEITDLDTCLHGPLFGGAKPEDLVNSNANVNKVKNFLKLVYYAHLNVHISYSSSQDYREK